MWRSLGPWRLESWHIVPELPLDSQCAAAKNQTLFPRLPGLPRELRGSLIHQFVVILAQAIPFLVEDAEAREMHFLKAEHYRGREDAETVLDAAAKVDRGGLGEIPGGTGNFSHAETEENDLREHFVVEDEVVAIGFEGKGFEDAAREGAVTGVIFREFVVHHEILKQGEDAVGDVFVKRHAARESTYAKDAGAEGDVIFAVSDHAGKRNKQMRRILVIGMDHDNDVGAAAEGFSVAGFLVAAVSEIFVMDEGEHAEFGGKRRGLVGAGVVNQNDFVDEFAREFAMGFLESLGGIERRHDYDDFFAIQHEQEASHASPATHDGFTRGDDYQRGRSRKLSNVAEVESLS